MNCWNVNAISYYPQHKDGNAQFTKLPLKPLSEQYSVEDILSFYKFSIGAYRVLKSENIYTLSWCRNAQVSFVEKQWLKMIIFQNYKYWYPIHTWSDTALRGTFVNQALTPLLERSQGSKNLAYSVHVQCTMNIFSITCGRVHENSSVLKSSMYICNHTPNIPRFIQIYKYFIFSQKKYL